MMAKKGQGLSLNVVVIAAIVLVVMIVLIAIFTGGVERIRKSLGSVNECQGDCVAQGQCRAGQEIYGLGCEKLKGDTPSEAPYCCVRKKDE